MLPQRIAQQSLRRVILQQPAYRYVAPVAIASSNALINQRRLVATETLSNDTAENAILAKQRRNRPISPHLAIYRPQITWIPSMLNRLTGIALSGTFYAFGAAYLVAPYLGWHLESAVLAASFAKWPVVLQGLTKFFVSLPFTFHAFNGIRHLVWDTASAITNKKVIQTGWTAVGLTVLSSLVLAFI